MKITVQYASNVAKAAVTYVIDYYGNYCEVAENSV